MHFWPKFGNTDFNWWWLFARTSSKWGKFLLLSSIWPWSSRSIVPKNNRDLNQGLFHLWSKFGDSSLNGWWVIARTSLWLTDRHTHTHTQATTIPEGQNWPRVKTQGLRWPCGVLKTVRSPYGLHKNCKAAIRFGGLRSPYGRRKHTASYLWLWHYWPKPVLYRYHGIFHELHVAYVFRKTRNLLLLINFHFLASFTLLYMRSS